MNALEFCAYHKIFNLKKDPAITLTLYLQILTMQISTQTISTGKVLQLKKYTF